MPKRYDWSKVKAEYVEGTRDDQGNIVWPTLEQLAQRYSLSFSTVQKRAARERWAEERKIFGRKVEEARREKKSEALASEAAQFDAEVLRIARAAITQVTAHLALAAKVYRETGEPMDAAELDRLSRALERLQRAGRLALGEATHSMELQGRVARKYEIEIVERIVSDPEAREVARELFRRAVNCDLG